MSSFVGGGNGDSSGGGFDSFGGGGDLSGGLGSGRHGDYGLPKIEYRKIVNLKLKHFTMWRESIARVGYSRAWHKELYAPSLKFLQSYDFETDTNGATDGRWDGKVREAYLVLCNTIPRELKYLIRKVAVGDAIGIWRALTNRFLHVTDNTLRLLRNEWNMLSMKSTGLCVDEFLSHVIEKSENLRRMGEKVSDLDEAQTALAGLSGPFTWIKNLYRIPGTVAVFEDVERLALDYAADHGLLKSEKSKTTKPTPVVPVPPKGGLLSTISTSNKPKRYCFAFNSKKGCTRPNCPFLHEKDPSKSPTPSVNAATAAKTDKRKCFGCGGEGHIKRNCPKAKDKKVAVSVSTDEDESPPDSIAAFTARMALNVNPERNEEWYFDGGATHHITNNFDDLIDSTPIYPKTFTVANTSTLVTKHVGSVKLGDVILNEVYFAPQLPIKLISESKILEQGSDVLKDAKSKSVRVVHPTMGLVLVGALESGLFTLKKVFSKGSLIDVPKTTCRLVACSAVPFDAEKVLEYHRVTGHNNFRSCFKQMDMTPGPVPKCEDCCLTKLPRSVIDRQAQTRASKPLYRIFADLSGRKRATLSGYRYYLLIIDDYSRKRWVYWMAKKSDTLDCFEKFVKMTERSHPNDKISVLRTDGGGEFISKRFNDFLESKGIAANRSAPYCQFQNGVAERSIGIIDNSARAMMSIPLGARLMIGTML
jgi:hypothetical protein